MAMNLKYSTSIFAILCIYFVSAKQNYKLCVPKQHLKDCEAMLEVETKSKAKLECIPARDRVECLTFILQRQADFVPVDPEDMYVASELPNQDFVLFQEYRTNEEPDAEFRYQAVIVVHKDLPISDLDQLKGLKSCHTGVDRNVGYKIPLTMLMRRSVFPKMTDTNLTPKENELKALSTFFSKSCIVGTWSPDTNTTSVWKQKYSNLCALCEHPDICDYPDNYSGYDGALRCLVHNGGQVAFTKVIFVRKFFGLPVGTSPAVPSNENPDDYRYLCVDGTKVPVRETACSWAARPWQGLLGHQDVLASISPLRQKVKQLSEIGFTTNSTWFTNVLGLTEKIHYVAENIPITPVDYLSKANYTAVIERGHGNPEPIVRLCVTSNVALAKCRQMAVFAFSRDVRPRMDCILQGSTKECLQAIQDNGADIASVDGLNVGAAAKSNLHAIFHEVYGTKKTHKYAVAVVKKGTSYMKISDLRGKKSCHNPVSKFSGVNALLYYLVSNGIITKTKAVQHMVDFFSGGMCLPQADEFGFAKGTDKLKECKEANPSKCLANNIGDVAFVSSSDLPNFDESQYELLCLNKENGGRDSLSNYDTCNVVIEPSRTFVALKDSIGTIRLSFAPLKLAKILEDKKDLFNIYGEYLKNENVIFSSSTSGLALTDPEDYNKFVHIYNTLQSLA